MKNKTWLVPVVALVLLVALLVTGCGGGTTTTAPTTTQATTAATTPAKTTTPAAATTTTAPATTTKPATTTTSAPVAGTPKYGGTLIVSEPIFYGKPLGWPAEAGFDSSVWMQIALEPLIRQSYNGEYIPLLAESWTVDYDAPSVTFKLRQGVKFHDGSTFNAQAVKFNYDYMIPTKTSSVTTWKSVDVIDEYTVRVNLSVWTNSALSNFSFSGRCFIVSPTAYEKNGIDWMKQNMVGTGPFMQDNIQPGVKVVYKKNPNYYGKDAAGNKLPYLDGIEYWGIMDPMTIVASLKSGAIMGFATAADKNLYELQQSGYTAVTAPNGVGMYLPDSAHATSPLSKQAVREAVEYALDKEAIADAMSYGFWGPAYQAAPPLATAYDPSLPGRKFDLDKAKQLLSEAGYPDGITLKFIGTSDNKDTMTAIQGQLAEANITVNLELADSAKFQEYTLSGWNNGYLYGGPSGASNWINSLSSFLNPESPNYAVTAKTAEFTALFNAARNSREKEQAKERAVVDYIYNTAMVLPVQNITRAWVTASFVKDAGFFTDAANFYWTPATAWLDK